MKFTKPGAPTSADLCANFPGDRRRWQDVVKATKKNMLVGMCLLAFPSLLGIYAMAHLYITNISGWLSAESNVLGALHI